MNMTENNNYITIEDFVKELTYPIFQTFKNKDYTVIGEVERINPFGKDIYIHLIGITGKVNIPITVYVPENIYNKLSFDIKPDMQLIVTGKVSLSRSQIKLNASDLKNAGIGIMKKSIVEWRKKYKDLINRDKKRISYCEKIAVISNSNIQGFIDFSTHLKYGYVKVYETMMQGNNLAYDIARKIEDINKTGQYDCICIIRGGGSYANLFEFNKPILLEAIANSKIPVLTAIGHESDKLLCDQVADMRFSTPTDLGKYLTSGVRLLSSKINKAREEIKSKYKEIKHKEMLNKEKTRADLMTFLFIFTLLIFILSHVKTILNYIN